MGSSGEGIGGGGPAVKFFEDGGFVLLIGGCATDVSIITVLVLLYEIATT